MSEKPKTTGHRSLSIPRMRPFSWRAFWILGFLYIVGNVASIPLLRAADTPLGFLLTVAVYTALTLVMIGVALFLAVRTELGAPLLERAAQETGDHGVGHQGPCSLTVDGTARGGARRDS